MEWNLLPCMKAERRITEELKINEKLEENKIE